MNKKEQFLKLKTHLDIAKLFDISFNNFKKIFYQTSKPYQYKSIEILKKNGGVRTIHSPNKKIKSIQRQLSDILYEIYPVKPSAHGFIKNKSIVTNATQHLGKKFIFNIDLKDFFGSIHYGRIKNLFMSDPFRFNQSVAIILAHICCFDNKLPQGAPTSPILTNMICWKLDSQLQKLAKTHNCTYTRYVDDITFSFTCTKFRLPRNILYYVDSDLIVGKHLNEIIEANGFKINFNKVRLTNPNMRMEVTGLTINEFPNVKRKYIWTDPLKL